MDPAIASRDDADDADDEKESMPEANASFGVLSGVWLR
jgi:hypothetical protein